jgi:hypothetical protein
MELKETWLLVLEYSPNYCDVRQFVRRYGALTEKLSKHVYIQASFTLMGAGGRRDDNVISIVATKI